MSGVDLGGLGRDMTEEQIAEVLREVRASRMTADTLAYSRGLAVDAVAALPVIHDPETAALLYGLPSAYIDHVERLTGLTIAG